MHFNPRPPRGERRGLNRSKGILLDISIHALREESDLGGDVILNQRRTISIHALREESDRKCELY